MNNSDDYLKNKIFCLEQNSKFKKLCAKSKMDNIIDFYNNSSANILNSTKIKMFMLACQSDKLELAKWLYSQITNANYDYDMHSNAIDNAIDHNCLEIIKWLFTMLPENPVKLTTTFRKCCEQGMLDIAKWLIEIYPNIDYTTEDNIIFKRACIKNNIDIVKWLNNINPICSNQLSLIYIEILLMRKKLPVNTIKWLHDITVSAGKFDNHIFDLCKELFTEENLQQAFKNSYINNLFDTVRWIIHIFDLFKESFNENSLLSIFKYVCRKGPIEIAKLFFNTFPSIQLSSCEAISGAICNNNLDIAQWLRDCSPDFVLESAKDSPTLNYVVYKNNLEAAVWVKHNWPQLQISSDLFLHTIHKNNLEMAEFIHREFAVFPHGWDIDCAFEICCGNNNLEMAKWLKNTFPKIDTRGLNDSILIEVWDNKHNDVYDWLLSLLKNDKTAITILIDHCYERKCSGLIEYIIGYFDVNMSNLNIKKRYRSNFKAKLEELTKTNYRVKSANKN